MSSAEVVGWLVGRLPDDWFVGEPTVTIDRDEVVIVGAIDAPAADDAAAAAEGRASRFRNDTRDARIEIAREAERKFARKVSWGVKVDDNVYLFTNLAAPAMTRLRQPERQVLDTPRRCWRSARARRRWHGVRLVGQNEQEWIASLRTALDDVDRVRREGPA